VDICVGNVFTWNLESLVWFENGHLRALFWGKEADKWELCQYSWYSAKNDSDGKFKSRANHNLMKSMFPLYHN